jgi:alpha-N-arabinofuranosidase
VVSHGTSVVLTSAKETDANSVFDPVKVVPATERIEGLAPSFNRTFPPYSITVLKIQTK